MAYRVTCTQIHVHDVEQQVRLHASMQKTTEIAFYSRPLAFNILIDCGKTLLIQ